MISLFADACVREIWTHWALQHTHWSHNIIHIWFESNKLIECTLCAKFPWIVWMRSCCSGLSTPQCTQNIIFNNCWPIALLLLFSISTSCRSIRCMVPSNPRFHISVAHTAPSTRLPSPGNSIIPAYAQDTYLNWFSMEWKEIVIDMAVSLMWNAHQ